MTESRIEARGPIDRELRWTRFAGIALLTAGYTLALFVSGGAFVAALLAGLGGGAVGLYHGMKP